MNAANKLKTKCPRGHFYTPSNTRLNKVGSRLCIACEREVNDSKFTERQRQLLYALAGGKYYSRHERVEQKLRRLGYIVGEYSDPELKITKKGRDLVAKWRAEVAGRTEEIQAAEEQAA
jgi:hypothetical protein